MAWCSKNSNFGLRKWFFLILRKSIGFKATVCVQVRYKLGYSATFDGKISSLAQPRDDMENCRIGGASIQKRGVWLAQTFFFKKNFFIDQVR